MRSQVLVCPSLLKGCVIPYLTIGLEKAENLGSGDSLHLGDAVGVTQDHTDLQETSHTYQRRVESQQTTVKMTRQIGIKPDEDSIFYSFLRT